MSQVLLTLKIVIDGGLFKGQTWDTFVIVFSVAIILVAFAVSLIIIMSHFNNKADNSTKRILVIVALFVSLFLFICYNPPVKLANENNGKFIKYENAKDAIKVKEAFEEEQMSKERTAIAQDLIEKLEIIEE